MIPAQINLGGVVALIPDGRVEYFHPALQPTIDAINDGRQDWRSVDFDDFVLTEPYVELADFHLAAPAIAFLEITNRCNLHCRHCYAYSGKSRDNELPTKKLLDLLDAFDEMGVLQVFLTGGEVFAHKDVLTIIRHARTKRFTTQIFTNGTLITEEALAAIPSTSFFVSFDTASPVRTIRGGMDFPTLRRLFDLFTKYGHIFRTAVSVHSQNLGDVEGIFEWCLRHKFPRPQWLETHPIGRALLNRDILLSPDKVSEAFAVYKRCMNRFSRGPQQTDNEETGTPRATPNIREIGTIKFCQRLERATGAEKCGRSTIYVASDGRVYPCTNCMSNDLFCAGTVLETSIQEIWENGFDQIRRITFGQYSVCGQCPVNKAGVWCQFRCPPLALNVSGSQNGCGATEYVQRFMLMAHEFWEHRRRNEITLTL